MNTEVKTHPITASAGGDNAFYHQCDPVQHNAPYAACLNKLAMHKEGKLPSLFSDCLTAITAGKCNAEGMRENELGKGVSLYYIPRAEIQAANAVREKLAAEAFAADYEKSAVKASKRQKSPAYPDIPQEYQKTEVAKKVDAAKEIKTSFDFSTALAKAITDEAIKASEKPVKVLAPESIPVVTGKQTMVEIARAMAAKRKAELEMQA